MKKETGMTTIAEWNLRNAVVSICANLPSQQAMKRKQNIMHVKGGLYMVEDGRIERACGIETWLA